jgi:hypothetical protein
VAEARKQGGLQHRLATAALLAALLPIESGGVRAQSAIAASRLPPVLIGTWDGSLKDLLGTFAFTVRLDEDGTYATQHVLLGGYTIRVRGRWTAEFPPASPEGSKGVISFEATQSEPEEFCSAGAQSNPVTIRGPNTLEFGDGSTDYPTGVLRRTR